MFLDGWSRVHYVKCFFMLFLLETRFRMLKVCHSPNATYLSYIKKIDYSQKILSSTSASFGCATFGPVDCCSRLPPFLSIEHSGLCKASQPSQSVNSKGCPVAVQEW